MVHAPLSGEAAAPGASSSAARAANQGFKLACKAECSGAAEKLTRHAQRPRRMAPRRS